MAAAKQPAAHSVHRYVSMTISYLFIDLDTLKLAIRKQAPISLQTVWPPEFRDDFLYGTEVFLTAKCLLL